MLAPFYPLALAVGLAIPASADKDPTAPYAALLAAHVKDGLVDYVALGKDRAGLDAYLSHLAIARPPSERDARIAHFVDAYNAFVLDGVLHSGRPRSVLDVLGFFKTARYRLAGQMVSLDQLEKELLDPFAQDPRTHFVLVCAAVGCPILEPKPYTGSPLEARLDAATRRYLASPAGARVSPGRLELSKIFDWYAKDFGGAPGALTFALKHLPAASKAKLEPNPEVGYLDYNWTLNQR